MRLHMPLFQTYDRDNLIIVEWVLDVCNDASTMLLNKKARRTRLLLGSS
jgi:hypothetical protein